MVPGSVGCVEVRASPTSGSMAIELLRSGGATAVELVVETVGCVEVRISSTCDSPTSGYPCVVDISSAGDVERGETGTSDCGTPAAAEGRVSVMWMKADDNRLRQ
jgi:hypothetical protein